MTSNFLTVQRVQTWVWRVLLLGLFIATAFFLLRTLDRGLIPDELIYMQMTKTLAGPDALYRSAVDHSPPGQPVMGLPFYWLFGNSVFAAKASVLCYTLLFIVSVVWITNVLTRVPDSVTDISDNVEVGLAPPDRGVLQNAPTAPDQRQNALWAAALAGFFASLYGSHIGVNPSSYAEYALVCGVACAVTVRRKHRFAGLWLVMGGALAGLGVMVKPSVVLEVAALLVLIYWLRRSWRDVVIFVTGATLVVVAFFAYFAAVGTLTEMVYVSFAMNLSYIDLSFLGSDVFDLQIQGTSPVRDPYLQEQFLDRTLPFMSALLVAAGMGLVWSLRHKRSLLLVAVLLWTFATLIEALLPVAMAIRYYFPLFAPLALLAAFAVDEMLRARWMSRAFVVIVAGVIVPLGVCSVTIIQEWVPASAGQDRADYAASIAFLDETLDEGDCVLNWGWLAGVTYFSDYAPCARMMNEGNMIPRGVYDVRPLRAWYLEDVLAKQPEVLARQMTWNLFPQLDRLIALRTPRRVFEDIELRTRYFTLDWSTYHAGQGSINGELDLIGYDLAPGRSVAPGDSISVTLYWRVNDTPDHAYQGFVHLVQPDNAAAKIATHDDSPADLPFILRDDPLETLATDRWRGGDVVVGRTYTLTVPATTSPGDYALITGMYRWSEADGFQPVPHTGVSGDPVSALALGVVRVAK